MSPGPRLGTIISETAVYIKWWISTFPGIAVLLTALGLILLAKACAMFLDPREVLTMKQPLLEIRNLKVHFQTEAGVARAVDSQSTIAPGEVMGLVGESGSGKSVTALSIMGLIRPPGKVVDGQILFQGKDLLSLAEREMQQLRGGQIAMIFQDPLTTLNPVIRVGEQIIEAIAIHQGKANAWDKAVRMLELVGISSPERRMMEYPHQLSGGMRQR